MIPGFIKLDSQRFYRDIWPHIEIDIEAIHSNLKEIRACKKEFRPAPPLLIYWGYKGEIRDNNSIVAVSFSDATSPDEHWVAPHLIYA